MTDQYTNLHDQSNIKNIFKSRIMEHRTQNCYGVKNLATTELCVLLLFCHSVGVAVTRGDESNNNNNNHLRFFVFIVFILYSYLCINSLVFFYFIYAYGHRNNRSRALALMLMLIRNTYTFF